MKKDKLVTAIIIMAVLGLLFSGYLSVAELSGGATCPLISSILGVPVCVIGFFFYAIILILAILLRLKKKR